MDIRGSAPNIDCHFAFAQLKCTVKSKVKSKYVHIFSRSKLVFYAKWFKEVSKKMNVLIRVYMGRYPCVTEKWYCFINRLRYLDYFNFTMWCRYLCEMKHTFKILMLSCFCDLLHNYVIDSETTWANEMNLIMNHDPRAGSIARPDGQQSSELPLYHGCPLQTL